MFHVILPLLMLVQWTLSPNYGHKKGTHTFHTKCKTYILLNTCTHNRSITRQCYIKIKIDSKTKSRRQIKTKCKTYLKQKIKCAKILLNVFNIKAFLLFQAWRRVLKPHSHSTLIQVPGKLYKEKLRTMWYFITCICKLF